MGNSLRLVLGDFDLTGDGYSESGVEVLADGTDRGTPIPINVAVQSWLQDGSVVVTQGYDNRDVTIRVRMFGTDALALAQVETALFAELGRPNTLAWTPADGYGPTSVFDVVTSKLDPTPIEWEDIAEAGPAPFRVYAITLTCHPFVRSVDEVVATAEKSGETIAQPNLVQSTIADGTSAAGWQGDYFRFAANGTQVSAGASTVTVVSGALNAATPNSSPAGVYRTLIRIVKNQSIDVSIAKQLVVTWRWDQVGLAGSDWRPSDFQCLANESVQLTMVDGTKALPRLTYGRATFQIPENMSTLSSLRFILDMSGSTANPGGQAESLYVDSIDLNNANLASGTPRQLIRTIDVAGSARTQGRVTIRHSVNALGDVLAYFRPNDGSSYSPPLRRWRTAGPGATPDASLVSGNYDNIATSLVTFMVPAQRLPRGRYLLMARMGGAASDMACNLLWNSSTMFGSTDVGPVLTGTTPIRLGADYRIFPVARLQLPTRDLDAASSANVRVELLAQPASGGVARLDEAWLFNLSTGRLVQVACGAGTPTVGGAANLCFIEPATVANPRPTVRIGSQADRSDARYALDSAFSGWQFPEFTPPSMQVFTVTTGALDAAVTLAHNPRWHTHAAA